MQKGQTVAARYSLEIILEKKKRKRERKKKTVKSASKKNL